MSRLYSNYSTMNTLSKLALTGAATALTLEQSFAAIDPGLGKVDATIK